MAGKKWTNKEDGIVRAYYSDTAPEILRATLPGRTLSSIYQRARILGLLKSPGYLSAEGAKRWGSGGTKDQKRCQFSKGHKPWNRGVNIKEILNPAAIEAMQQTQFKKGQRPATAHASGTIFAINDSKGTPYQWISMEQGKAKLLHVYVWEQHNGEVPKGSIVRFKDGDRSNCVIDNLICVTRSENMKMNSYHRYGTDIAKAIQLRGALNRQINKRIKCLTNEK